MTKRPTARTEVLSMFCKNCGAALQEGAGFCVNCGAAVVQSADQPPSGQTPPNRGDQPTMVRPPTDTADQPTVVRTPADATDQPTVVRSAAETAEEPAVSHSAVVVPPPVVPPPAATPAAPAAAPPAAAAPPYGPRIQGGPSYGQGPAGPHGPFGPSGYPPPPAQYGPPPQKKSRTSLWMALAATAVIVIGAVVAVLLLVLDKDEVATTSTTKVAASSTTTTSAPTTTSSAVSTTTSSASTTTLTLPPGEPGDSAGQWVEVQIPGLPQSAFAVAVSDQALLIDAQVDGDAYVLYAYMFDSEQLIELPIDGVDFFGEDLDGLMAVWWEGTYDPVAGTYSDEYIYAYPLPNGPKVQIAGDGRSVYYPQVAGEWVTWVEEEPWEENPEEYWFDRIYGVRIDSSGNPRNSNPILLVAAATSFAQGDAIWTYSLSDTHLVWENATAVDAFDPGIYAMDLASRESLILGSEIWRPSTAGDKVVYTDVGITVANLDGQGATTLDPLGDFATAAPSYAVYFRWSDQNDTTSYDIVARGFTGGYEQTLGSQEDPPWFSPFLSASANHVAFIVNEQAHLFEWEASTDDSQPARR